MTSRPVFRVWDKCPYVAKCFINFDWFPGMSKAQKQRSIRSLHEAFHEYFPDQKVLEISSKSEDELGVKLSAFNLMKYVPSLGKSVPVECIYQAGKVFENGGPYLDLLEAKPKDAKKDPRLKESGKLIGYYFDGENFPLKPTSLFYDYIYTNALLENPELAAQLMEYDAFTDIEFNPQRAINCQAHAAARYVSMCRQGLQEEVRDQQSFFE